MRSRDDNTPVIVGVGQVVQRDKPSPETLRSAVDLAAEAALVALTDSGAEAALRDRIDVLTAIRLFEHSTRKVAIVTNPLGESNNVPGSIAKRLGARPKQLIYAAVGGQSPQRLINESAERIHAGEINCAVITGAEAIANIKYAVRNGVSADWSETIDEEFEDRWQKNNADNMVSEYEMAHGLFLPVQAYPLFEHAHRRELGHTLDDHRAYMGRLFADFTSVAAENPIAQFPTERSADFLAEPSPENYLLSEPYTKWMVAQDAVNQGAAVVVTSVALAKEMGIDQSRWTYLHAYADVDDFNVVERPDLARSYAQKLAIDFALDAAGKRIDDIAHLDIYSCFPIAVTSACDALGIDPFSRRLTLTGGLPFFGGPGNNYSMHAIAEVIARCRHAPDSFGLIIANGGYLSKHSVGVYSNAVKSNWQPLDSGPARALLQRSGRAAVTENPSGSGVIESYVAAYHKGAPAVGYVFARQTSDKRRFIATVDKNDRATLEGLFTQDPLDKHITVSPSNGINTFQFTTNT